MTKLALSPELKLPADAVTQTFGILGARGSGKSNAAVVLAEEMFAAGLHWVAIDPKGDWWGMRSSRDGKAPGLPIVVFGGRHADVPLEASAGPMLAELIADQALTCVLDLSEFTEGDKIRFMAGHGRDDGFAARLLRRKTEQQAPTHLFLEEADDYLPQQIRHDKAKLHHDCSRLFLWGRSRGISGTLIAQRSARLHKDVLTQIGNLIVFRTMGPQDRDAILKWVEYHGQARELVASLAELDPGECWFWSPQWLHEMKRLRFRLRETFDSGATPAIGKKARPPATIADVDLGVIKDKMAATIEKAKAEDPRELKKTIADLQKQLKARPEPAAPVKSERIEVPALKDSEIKRVEAAAEAINKAIERGIVASDAVSAAFERGTVAIGVLGGRLREATEAQKPKNSKEYASNYARPKPGPGKDMRQKSQQGHGDIVPKTAELGSLELLRGHRSIVEALARVHPARQSRSQLGRLAGQSLKSSSFKTYYRQLKAADLIDEDMAGIGLSPRGIEEVGLAVDLGSVSSPAQRLSMWRQALLAGERAILDRVVDVWPNAIAVEDLADGAGQSLKSSSFKAYVRNLKRNGLVHKNGDGVRASEELMA